jgi:hypothetical protein
MTPARFRWGVLFILIGVLILLTNVDVLNHNFWIDFIYMFPFLLIAIGIEKIFAHTRLKGLSYLTTVLLAAGAFYVAFEGSRLADGPGMFKSSTLSYEHDDSVEVIEAVLTLADANLTIRKPTDDLMYARFDEWTYKPRASYFEADGQVEIKLNGRAIARHFGGVKIGVDGGDDGWRVSFSREVPLLLTCSGNDCDVHMNLATTPLRELQLDLDDADVYVKLGELEPEVRVGILGSDSKLRLRIPQESGLGIIGVDDPEYLREIGLRELDDQFVSEGFEEAPNRILVELEDNFRSLSIDYY